jgi:hypothetical protein
VALHSASPVELKAQIEAERDGTPFLVFRDGAGTQQILPLSDARERLTVGRIESTDIALTWDASVSRVHAELVRVAEDWTVADDGLSRFGSYVNGQRLTGRRRLEDGDRIQIGEVVLLYRRPRSEHLVATQRNAPPVDPTQLSAAQKRVLVALCRPFADGATYATPASNQDIADELFLSVAAVKGHLRTLFDKFGVGDLPHNQKRLKLVERALLCGAVAERDLRE